MVDFSVDTLGTSPTDMQERLNKMGGAASGKANDALKKTAVEVKEDLEDTSPVDTGEYQDSWYIAEVAEDEVWILNGAEHAQFVMLPNSKMVGAANADLPGSGVLHNVEGVARSHKEGVRSNLAQEIQEMMDGIGT